MRISEPSQHRNLLRELERSQERIHHAQLQVASGKRVLKPSDDPTGVVDVVRLSSERTQSEQFERSLTHAQAKLGTIDSVLSTVESVVGRIRELGYSAQGSLANPQSFIAEMESLQDQLFLSANSVFQGQFLFGGSHITAAPFVRQTDGSAIYAGNAVINQLQVGPNQRIDTQLAGDQVFMGGVDIFATVRDLITAVQSADRSATDTQLRKIESFADQVSTARSKVGALLNTAERAVQENTAAMLQRESQLSDVLSTNLAESLTELRMGENSREATLAVAARVGQVNLFDFI